MNSNLIIKQLSILGLTVFMLGCESNGSTDHQEVGVLDTETTDATYSVDAAGTLITDASPFIVDLDGLDARTSDVGMLDAGAMTPVYPSDDELRVNHLQALGTHNSYHLAPEIMFLPWNYDHLPLDRQLEVQGVRQVELDFYQNNAGTFDVYHLLFADEGSTCATLSTCLGIMKVWSDQNPGHHPILLLIEPKGFIDPPDMVISKLNSTLIETWGRDRLLTPDMVIRDQRSLRDGLAAHGWPTLGETRNRLMAVLHTSGRLRDANQDVDSAGVGSVMFPDAYGDIEVDFAAYHSMNNPVVDQAAINALVRANHLVRTRADADLEESQTLDYQRSNAALSSGAHFISTDFPFPGSATDYGFVIPQGSPSRCNPLTAPATCQSVQIENLYNETVEAQ
jgi:hypothetical protein